MAFDENDDIHPIGTFQSPSDGQLINCTSNGLVSDNRTIVVRNKVCSKVYLRTLPHTNLKRMNS
jgi:hypothetical protein